MFRKNEKNVKLFWGDLMGYSYLFVTRNLGVGGREIQQTSERGIKILN